MVARPTCKEDLLHLSKVNFQKLFTLIDTFTTQEQNTNYNFEYRDKNLRDTLCHLHEWHLMMYEWYNVGMSGKKPDMPSKGYTWKTLPNLNQKIWEKYQNTSLDEAKELLESSFRKVQKLIKAHTNDELFTKKYYKWTNTTSLGSYFISATSSHYDWALKYIKKHKKSLHVSKKAYM